MIKCDRCDREIKKEPYSNEDHDCLCRQCFEYSGSDEEQADLKDKAGESRFEQKTGR
ncbi:MAG: hypothetical protein WC477_07140 [Patescibacteria group bacterium]